MIYFNTAGAGLIAPKAVQIANQFNEELAAHGSNRVNQWKNEDFPSIRETVAQFLNAPTKNIALIPNFSYGFYSIVQSLKGKKNKVLLYKEDYPSLNMPFEENGFEIHWIKDNNNFSLDTELIKSTLLEHEIEILALSHIQYISGFKIDIASLVTFCKKHNIVCIVDATQSAGAVELDIESLQPDVLIFSNYKWMNAGFGSGVLYASDAFLAKFPPNIAGNASHFLKDGAYVYEPGISSFEPGHQNMAGLLMLQASIQDKNSYGIQEIESYNHQLTRSILEVDSRYQIIGDRNANHYASIVAFKDNSVLYEQLNEANIRTTRRAGTIRTALHVYNTMEQVTTLINIIKR